VKVSVIVPTRNSGRTVEACLKSVCAQTHSPVELLVCDNRSTDATPELAARLADRLFPGGPERSAQRNAAASRATGDAFLFVDSDMILTERVVAECVEAAEGGADAVVVPEASFGRGFWACCKALERSCYVGDDSIEAARFFTRRAFEQALGYDEALVAGEDWDLHRRVVEGGAVVARTSAQIWHDEGRLRLSQLAVKKYRYGRTLGAYIGKHPALAGRQLRLIRPAFIRHRRRLAAHPLVTAGMIVMKSAEAAAGATGLLVTRLR
jgi:glycosyltransferase involved in cell wall biosynthesis